MQKWKHLSKMSLKLSSESLKEPVEKCSGNISDTRIRKKTAYKLIDIIAISSPIVICGVDGWVGIETYGKTRQTWLKTILELPNGIPSHNRFAKVIGRLDSQMLQKIFKRRLNK